MALKRKALVCYACPVFHKEAMLHKLIINARLVEHSTFPDVATLANHEAWNFSSPGATGVANPEPTYSEGSGLLERLSTLVEQGESDEGTTPTQELQSLADAARQSMLGEEPQNSSVAAQFADGLLTVERIASDSAENQDALLAYGTVLLFAHLNRVDWLVAGRWG